MLIPKKLAIDIYKYLAQQPCQEVYAMYTELVLLIKKAEDKPELRSPDLKEK